MAEVLAPKDEGSNSERKSSCSDETGERRRKRPGTPAGQASLARAQCGKPAKSRHAVRYSKWKAMQCRNPHPRGGAETRQGTKPMQKTARQQNRHLSGSNCSQIETNSTWEFPRRENKPLQYSRRTTKMAGGAEAEQPTSSSSRPASPPARPAGRQPPTHHPPSPLRCSICGGFMTAKVLLACRRF